MKIFYGTVYGSGNVQLNGTPQTGLNIDIAATTGRNTYFTYMYEGVYSAASDQFITFVDRTPRREEQTEASLTFRQMAQQYEQQAAEEDEGDSDLRINLQAEVTPDATIRVVMDPATGDGIRTRGSGNVRADFYNKGDFRMFGNYNVTQGTYQFSIQEIIRKEFNLKQGSSISFSGNPEQAVLDLHAGYIVNTVSLNDLIPNASSYVDQTNIKVECLMNLTGQLSAPEVKLSLDFPQERDEVQALVRNYIPTDEQMNMQILYLLGIGKFYTYDYSNSLGTAGTQNNTNTTAVESLISNTLSGQINNMLGQIIDNGNWNISGNFSTSERGWNSMEVEGMLEGRLLNDRLLINGNLGYRENPVANRNVIGDFELQWLLNRTGTISLRAYSKTNDRYFSKTNLTTQGAGIILRHDFNSWKWWKKDEKEEKEKKEKRVKKMRNKK